LSVTIVNHESRNQLRRCLHALRQNPYTMGDMEVVVLDNASQDGSVGMLRSEFPEVVVLEESRRRGFGENQNLAVAAAQGSLLFLLNPDTTINPGSLNRLVAALDSGPGVVAAAGPIYHSDGTMRQARPFPPIGAVAMFAKAVGWRRVAGRPWEDRIFRRGWLSGGSFIIDRRAFEAVGGFDEGFFMYAEDADLFTRLADRGFSFAWVQGAGVIHPLPDESAAAIQKRAAEIVRGELHYARKHLGRTGRFFYRVAVGMDAGVRLAAFSIPGLSSAVGHHGKSADYHRLVNRARLKAALMPQRGIGLAESAAEWNCLNTIEGRL
jgi:GT2 family glycosyltransferase